MVFNISFAVVACILDEVQLNILVCLLVVGHAQNYFEHVLYGHLIDWLPSSLGSEAFCRTMKNKWSGNDSVIVFPLQMMLSLGGYNEESHEAWFGPSIALSMAFCGFIMKHFKPSKPHQAFILCSRVEEKLNVKRIENFSSWGLVQTSAAFRAACSWWWLT